MLRSFRVRLFTLLLLLLIPGLGIALYGNFEQRRIEKNRACEGALAISELAASNQEDFMGHAQQIMATLTEFPWLVLSTNEAFVRGNLANLCKLLPNYATFGLIETNGAVFCSAKITNNTANLGDRSYFQRVLRTKKFAVGDFQIGRVTGQPSIDLGYPVLDEHGELRRVLFAALGITNFYNGIKDIRVPAKGALTVIDRSGNVVARCPGNETIIGKSLLESPAVKQILEGKRGTFESKGPDGIARLYAVTPAIESQEPRLFVVVEIPLADLVATANRVLVRNIVMLAGLAILLYAGGVWYARHFFVNPVRMLTDSADRLAAGDLTARVGALRGPVELGHLGRALDTMAGAVQERTRELLRANEALRKEMAERERAEQEARHQAAEKKKLEEQFLRSQRMESLGALAGGIAHDLNNALVPVLMGSELLQEASKENPERQQVLDLIAAGGKRCTAMVKQILTFAKGTRSESGSVPVRHLVLEMAKIAKETFPKSICLECSVPNDLWMVEGEATELYQILMNLCVNARDAMPDGGTLTLKSANLSLSREQVPSDCNSPNGQFVLLTVGDTGTGIPPEIQERIFEPFFTTKAADKGTGLGLSTVWSLVKRHNGFIQLESQVGKGTQFKIYLRAIAEQKAETAALDVSLPLGNGETILLVDDEQMVLELTKTLLENYRYRVLTATNGLEAITCFEEHRKDISLMITDRDMPFMDGMTAARRVRSMAPDLPVIVASASQPDTVHLMRTDPKNFAFLNKPYNSGHLLKCIADALGAVRSRTHLPSLSVATSTPHCEGAFI